MLAEGGDYAQRFITDAERDMIIITGSANNLAKSRAVCKEIIPISTTSQARMVHTQRMCTHLCYAHICADKTLHSEPGASV